MAPKNRSARIRKLATSLSEQFGLDYAKHQWIEAEYDDRRSEWTLSWVDGPTVTQVSRAARTADKEAIEGVRYERRYSPQAYALGAIGWALAGADLQGGEWWATSRVEEHLAKVKNPGRPKPGRESDMVERLLTAADKGRGRTYTDGSEICGLVDKRGLAWLLIPAGKPDEQLPLTPLELLTARYAWGEKQKAWREHLAPLTELEALAAVQADQEASAEAVEAVLTLVPDVHAAIDSAVAELRTRLPAAP
ncbi:hypothetical protein ABR738_00910 [Streptomyces sp. Edi4]|uniref:hypothetical protein n=1 Tax=Streptomyces sp. Edi4 TaxID=3162527 RepID=UPI0033057101